MALAKRETGAENDEPWTTLDELGRVLSEKYEQANQQHDEEEALERLAVSPI